MKVACILLVSILLGACAHFQYPVQSELGAGRSVVFMDGADDDCEQVGVVSGKIRQRNIDEAVGLALVAARNKAAEREANVLVYDRVRYLRAFLDHSVLVAFDAYACPPVLQKSDVVPEQEVVAEVRLEAHEAASKASKRAAALLP